MMLYTGLSVKQQEARVKATQAYREWADENLASDCPTTLTVGDFSDYARWEWLARAMREADL